MHVVWKAKRWKKPWKLIKNPNSEFSFVCFLAVLWFNYLSLVFFFFFKYTQRLIFGRASMMIIFHLDSNVSLLRLAGSYFQVLRNQTRGNCSDTRPKNWIHCGQILNMNERRKTKPSYRSSYCKCERSLKQNSQSTLADCSKSIDKPSIRQLHHYRISSRFSRKIFCTNLLLIHFHFQWMSSFALNNEMIWEQRICKSYNTFSIPQCMGTVMEERLVKCSRICKIPKEI